jgi:endonuclease YncB( thermonuclease family)
VTVGWIGRGFHDNDWLIGPTPARWQPVTLVGVVDGDTIKVKWDTQVTSVRMLNINTPERGQPGYREATENLKAMLGNATAVMLDFEKDGVHARDSFGRLLCYVWLNGKNLCVEQVRAGHSVFWSKYGAGKYPTEFRVAMREAQGAPVPTAP